MKQQALLLYSQWCQWVMEMMHPIVIEKQCRILGIPRIRMKRGSRIHLRRGVTILSSNRFNPLITKPMQFNTFSDHALIDIGEEVGMSGSHIACCERICIGDQSIIGPECLIFDWKAHDFQSNIGWSGRKSIRGAAISIGRQCYIGARCTILKGVTIGDRCVIAAATLVDKDVPSGHIAQGNPMQISPLPPHLGKAMPATVAHHASI